MVKILLIGNGAREHAIAEAVVRSKHRLRLFSFMKANNPGIASLSEETSMGSYSDLPAVSAFAKRHSVDFAIIGPEDPLNNGIVDMLTEIGIQAVGPTKSLARLETSKSFTRNLLRKYNIPGNPKFKIFTSMKGIKEFLGELDGIVVKPDGLTGGKGVMVQGDHFQTQEEALAYCEQVLAEHQSVTIDERLEGEEFSLQCLCDGKTVVATPLFRTTKDGSSPIRALIQEVWDHTLVKTTPSRSWIRRMWQKVSQLPRRSPRRFIRKRESITRV